MTQKLDNFLGKQQFSWPKNLPFAARMRLIGIEITTHSYFVPDSFRCDLHPQKILCGPKGGITSEKPAKEQFKHIHTGCIPKKTQKFNFPLKMINKG